MAKKQITRWAIITRSIDGSAEQAEPVYSATGLPNPTPRIGVANGAAAKAIAVAALDTTINVILHQAATDKCAARDVGVVAYVVTGQVECGGRMVNVVDTLPGPAFLSLGSASLAGSVIPVRMPARD